MAHSGAAWQRAVADARRLREFAVWGDGVRVRVDTVHYAPELRLAWVELENGTWRLPPQMLAWAAFVFEEVPGHWGTEDFFPFMAHFSKRGNEWLVEMEPPQ